MGVPAFFRWLTEKYPKVMEDVLEERVDLLSAGNGNNNVAAPFDCSRPNPSGLETDNLYVDMNGIIHPCSHPEVGPAPTCEEEMYENVCLYVDRLVCAVRPRRMLYLAIDGVAPRAKMNQQRSRRFRSAQEVRELQSLQDDMEQDLIREGCQFDAEKMKKKKSGQWDSNVITPGTKFMLKLSQHVRFYIRQKQSSGDPYWQSLLIVFSDASIPGEGEHKIMTHIRHQRTCKDTFNPNMVHVLHGLDADLIMLALATHEAHFYILREEVVFGRRGQEQSTRRKEESGFLTEQQKLDEQVGSEAMTTLLENQYNKPLQRLSIPVLRDYLSGEFRQQCQSNFGETTSTNNNNNNCTEEQFATNLERVIDDVVFLCFFVGNDFLPHLPSLDIRDGALDFLFNVYKSILPSLGGFITSPGGNVNLQHVDVILSHVGAIENHVFAMKHEQDQKNKEYQKERKKNIKKNLTANGQAPKASYFMNEPPQPKKLGKAGKLLMSNNNNNPSSNTTTTDNADDEEFKPLGRSNNHQSKKLSSKEKFHQKVNQMNKLPAPPQTKTMEEKEKEGTSLSSSSANKRKETEDSHESKEESSPPKKKKVKNSDEKSSSNSNNVDDDDDLFNIDDEEDDDKKTNKKNKAVEITATHEESEELLKLKVKEANQKKLDQFSNTVQDKVRLHEPGWKDRYYSDKCKADDVANHGGREHLFRSYIKGLCWVMKYYYEGCPSWKWYYPFHYGPFASDLRNIERFETDCNFDKNKTEQPFRPIEQLMAVLPEDSSHAIPQASRWLMADVESPIIDFYPVDVPTDPNGKAMPWLWVVLLPFIDEERLLGAMKATMEKWSPQERLYNARGLDDGYIYVHSSHLLAQQQPTLLLKKKEDKQSNHQIFLSSLTTDVKERFGSVNGCIRLPLSDELHDLHATIQPTVSTKLLDPIDMNQSICLTFLEPPIADKVHESILLPGTVLPPSILTNDDRRIRRPRLNRGGGSISNLGMSGNNNRRNNNTSFSNTNIGAYEQNLMTSKNNNNSHHYANKNYNYNRNDQQQQQQQQRAPWGQLQQPPPPNFSRPPPPNMFQPHMPSSNNNNRHVPPNGQFHSVPPPPPPRYQMPPPPHARPHNPSPPMNNQQHRNNNNNNNNNNSSSRSTYSFNRQGQQQQQQDASSSSRVNPKLMQSLRSQLASTLNQKNRRGGNGNGSNK